MEIRRSKKPHADQIRALEQLIRDYGDYPTLLTHVYSELMILASAGTVPEPDTELMFADEALAKYPTDVNLRRSATLAKLRILTANKRDAAARALTQKLLETETEPLVLNAVATAVTPDEGPKLFEKAIAERRKNPVAASPSLGEIMTRYAGMQIQWRHKEEGTKLAGAAVEEFAKELAELDAMRPDEASRVEVRSLRREIGMACQYELTPLFADVGDYQKALECVGLVERASEPGDAAFHPAELRAGIATKMGNPEAELEIYTKLFAAEMDPRTRDRIRDLAAKSGTNPGDAFERARQIRNADAQQIKPFQLKTVDGKVVALRSLKAKAVLVSFFFPT